MEVELMKSLAAAGGYAAIGLAAIGSSLGTGIAGSAAIGAWKKCYQQDKPASFLLLAMAGAPLSQTIYGLLMMIFIKGKAAEAAATSWPLYLSVGVFGGLALMISALYQGKAAAGGCNAFGETNQGFANYLMILGVVETCAIFALVFSLLAM
ncbi:MAG: hypothetical protein PHI35_07170 [Victivallaceae bacterium]|nr:hypothetical protein [Victivallaceae bacterium]